MQEAPKNPFSQFGAEYSGLWDRIRDELTKQAINALSYEPSIGILGKTGAGKSTLVNALFGSNVRDTSTYKGCSRDVGTVTLEMDGKKLYLYDLPGAGESMERDKEYAPLYKEVLPKLDVVLWVIKADDRALTSDEIFYKNIILPHLKETKTPLLFVLSNADKMEPTYDVKWDKSQNPPTVISLGEDQIKHLDLKMAEIAKIFHVDKSKVVAVSSTGKWNLKELTLKIIQSVPAQKKAAIYDRTEKDVRSEEATKETSDDVVDMLVDGIITALPVIAPELKVLHVVINTIKEPIKKAAKWVWNKVSGWFPH